MERTTLLGRLTWQIGEVVATHVETAHAKSLTIALPQWTKHQPGQHVDVRLTAEDGYQAERSYSIASAPQAQKQLAITVERLEDGEVSPYLVDELRVGDQLELRGPIGGYFVWEPRQGGPLLLVAGGSGIVPLMAMLRHRQATGSIIPTRLLYSSRSYEEIIYREELDALSRSDATLEVYYTLTRTQPPDWIGYRRRIDQTLLGEVAWPSEQNPLTYVCGPTQLVESVAAELVALGHEPAHVKTERFGPTGGA
jgi:ferredoxin-NADP reductase